MDNITSVNHTFNDRYPEWLRVVNGSASLMIMLGAVVLNAITILVFLRVKKLRSVDGYFIISLSAADLLFSFIVVIFTIARFALSHWVTSKLLCTLAPCLAYANTSTSLFTVTAITLNRYIKIAHYKIHRRVYEKRNIVLMIAFCWGISYFIQVPTLLGVWGRFGYDPLLGTCDILQDDLGRSSKHTLLAVGFMLPCLVIVTCYLRILYVVSRSERRMRSHMMTQVDTEGIRKQKEFKRMAMILTIFLAFIACYLPAILVKIVDKEIRLPGLHVLGYLFFNMSTCINPLIYVLLNDKYRTAYRSVLSPIVCWCCDKKETLEKPSTQNSKSSTNQTSDIKNAQQEI